METIDLTKLNESYYLVDTNDIGILFELEEHFKFRKPGFQFSPAYRHKRWDGYTRLFSARKKLLQTGLVPFVKDFCQKREYKLTGDLPVVQVGWSTYHADRFEKQLQLPYKMDDYQRKALSLCVNNKKQIIESATGSGKSLVIYSFIRYWLDNEYDGSKKLLLFVPTIQLVEQMLKDFQDYSANNGWRAADLCHCQMGGVTKKTDKPIVISTWQSVFKLDADYFSQFDTVVADECHKVTDAKAIQSILEKSTNAQYKLGFTGTIKGGKVHAMILQAIFGPVAKVAKTAMLIDRGRLAPVKVKCVVLDYSDEFLKKFKFGTYHEQIDQILTYAPRQELIINLGKRFPQNALVLYQYVQKHGVVMHQMASDQITNKQIHFVSGAISKDEREQVRTSCSDNNNNLTFASYGTFAAGINIPSLQYLILSSPTKAEITVLQSIGRILRKHEGKESAIVYDLVDNIQRGKQKVYMLNHFKQRLQYYKEQKFPIEIIKIKI